MTVKVFLCRFTQLSQDDDDDDNDDGDGSNSNNADTLTERMVQSTFKQMVAQYKANGKQPLCYFRFVIGNVNSQ